jgi:hypothetical protein
MALSFKGLSYVGPDKNSEDENLQVWMGYDINFIKTEPLK